jgi:hypothetical protein
MKGKSVRAGRLALFAAALAAVPWGRSFGADKSWAGGSGTWQIGTWLNTSGAVTAAPGAGDNAYIISSSTLTVFRDATSGSVSGMGTVAVDGTGGALVTLAKSGATVFSIGNLVNGINGNAAFDFSGGTVILSGYYAGQNSGAAGVGTLGGSSFSAATMTVGAAGAGTLIQTAGTTTFSSSLVLGQSASGSGAYTLSGGTLSSTGTSIVTTVGSAGFGQLTVDGGYASLGVMNVGSTSGAVGHVTVHSGTLIINNTLRLAGAGGTANFQVSGGRATISGLQSTAGGYFINDGGDVSLAGLVQLNGGHVDLGASNFNVTSNNILVLNDGYFAAGAITASNASIQFSSGTLVLNNSNFNPLSGILGPGSIDLTQTRALSVSGTTTLLASQPIIVEGGTFSTGTLSGNIAALQFLSGTLRLTGSNFSVSSGGLFGSTLTLEPARTLAIANGNSASIDAGAQLNVTGGMLNVETGALTNAGIIQLSSPTARIGAATIVNQGLLQGTGRVLGPLDNQFQGEVRVAANEQIRFETAIQSDNSGLINLLGGFADFTGILGNSGRITGRGTLRTSFLANSGTFALSAGVSDIQGDVTNTGRIIISGNANVSFWDDVSNSAGGSVKVSPGSTVSFFGTYGGGGITGGGSVNFESDITPGFSPAAIPVAGNVTFGDQAKLRIELAGTTRGTQFDAIDIFGTAALDGELHVSTLNGFIPLPGMTFNVMTFDSHASTFDLVNDTGYAGLTITPGYSATSLQLTMSGVGGDANLDGMVDIRDLYVLAIHYKQTGQNWLTADFNADGKVNAADLGLLAQHWQFGAGVPGGASLDSLLTSLGLPTTSVPEPELTVSMVGASLLLRRKRALRQRQRKS